MLDRISLRRSSNMLSLYLLSLFKFEIVQAAAAKKAIGFNPGSALATVPTVRDLLQSYARTTALEEFAIVMKGMIVGYGSGSVQVGWFFQFAFAANAATIVAGTVADGRCKFEAYNAYSLALTGFVYPVVVHSIWSSDGFLSDTTISAASLITEINDEYGWGRGV